jgi:mono/diheme cytochrome c family protein
MSLRSWYLLTLLAAGGSAQAMSAGEYVAKAGDCTACHTAPGGALLAGGMKFPTPLGAIYATNITPDKQHGIGAYSFDEFDRAMRQGITKDGHRLYPAMPYTSYAKMNAADMRALYDYLMQEVPAQNAANRAGDIRWPFGISCSMTMLNISRTTGRAPSGTAALIWCRARATAAVAIRRAAGQCRKRGWTARNRPS